MSDPQFTLYSHAGGVYSLAGQVAAMRTDTWTNPFISTGPNGWKVAIVLKALNLTYETKFLDFRGGDDWVKGPAFTKINPNGRIPAIIDHANGDFTLWESNAIILYLVDTYDAEKKLTFSDPKERALLNQYLFFQASGQGPYYGQAFHFIMGAPEKIEYAVGRYKDETERVLSVLESILSKQQYLVGGKLTVADLSFVTWNVYGTGMLRPDGAEALEVKFPAVAKWHSELLTLPWVKEVLDEKAALSHK